MKDVLATVGGVRGVREIENQLDVRSDPGQVPELQGGHRRERRPELLQDHWTPTTRVVIGTLAGSALLRSVRMRGPVGGTLSAVAAGTFARAVMNRPLLRGVRARLGDMAIKEEKDRSEDGSAPRPD